MATLTWGATINTNENATQKASRMEKKGQLSHAQINGAEKISVAACSCGAWLAGVFGVGIVDRDLKCIPP